MFASPRGGGRSWVRDLLSKLINLARKTWGVRGEDLPRLGQMMLSAIAGRDAKIRMGWSGASLTGIGMCEGGDCEGGEGSAWRGAVDAGDDG